ncbi:MAG TPA: DNA-binding protein, partial [Syntrophobacteraceae bacterium]|nr:DNA-binding protein [Syntrophobacteraceae bacterium]
MEYDEGTMGRIFTLRLGDGDRLPDTIEVFAQAKRIRNALVFYLGGAADGSRLVVGPEENRGDAVVPMIHTLRGAQEVLAVGTLFPSESGEPVLHMHAA